MRKTRRITAKNLKPGMIITAQENQQWTWTYVYEHGKRVGTLYRDLEVVRVDPDGGAFGGVAVECNYVGGSREGLKSWETDRGFDIRRPNTLVTIYAD